MENKVKKNDLVRVISGSDKGKQGKVIAIRQKQGKTSVKVHGVGVVAKHYKARSNNEQSGIRMQERFIDVSNVSVVRD